jgi:hypothetical protein
MSETRRMEKTFYEELQLMPYKHRCIVLGIVLGTSQKEMFETLKISHEEMRVLLHEEGLYKWHLFRALLGN